MRHNFRSALICLAAASVFCMAQAQTLSHDLSIRLTPVGGVGKELSFNAKLGDKSPASVEAVKTVAYLEKMERRADGILELTPADLETGVRITVTRILNDDEVFMVDMSRTQLLSMRTVTANGVTIELPNTIKQSVKLAIEVAPGQSVSVPVFHREGGHSTLTLARSLDLVANMQDAH